MKFVKATKKQAKLRLALMGPSGSGKSYSSLAIGSHLEGPLAVIDTERGSASLYSSEFKFDVLELDTFSPEKYIEAIKIAAQAGYKTLVIDSLSHAWSGAGGALEMVDKAAKQQQSGGNSFTAWRSVTPLHNKLVDTILGTSMHVIVTMRTKTEYVLEENEKGKKMPKKIGLAPIQRDGLEYEFTIVADMNLEHDMIVTKTRCSALTGGVYHRPGKDVATMLTTWLNDGAAQEVVLSNKDQVLQAIAHASLADDESIRDMIKSLAEDQKAEAKAAYVSRFKQLQANS